MSTSSVNEIELKDSYTSVPINNDEADGKLGLKYVNSASSLASMVSYDSETGFRKGISLEWTDIQFFVPGTGKPGDNCEKKVLLHSMSGQALPGEILGIMGTSGAGKSTLLDVLAGRIESPDLSGQITMNGTPIKRSSYRKQTGYVMQSDALFPLLTVRETIRYAAYLRVANKTKEEKDQIAEDTINLLKLSDCADTHIGDDHNKGISGGQKRRVSIAVDIVHRPAAIFLDEPTSGLDSSTALSVVQSLRELAQIGITIVLTIHQPSAKIFSLLDKVMFLSQGKVTYNGPVSDLSSYITNFYAEAGLGKVQMGNMPEVFLDMCDTLIEQNKLDVVTSKFATSTSASTNSTGLDLVESASKSTTTATSTATTLSASSHSENVYANSLWGDFAVLFSRSFLNVLRTPELFFARLGASIGFGVMIGTLFLFTPDTLLGVQHRMSYFVFTVAFYLYTSLEALPIFLAEREIFAREYSRGAYRAVAYTLANSAVMFLPYLAVALMYTFVTYWLVGMPAITSVWFFHVFTVFTILNAGSAFATMLSTLVPSPMIGQSMGSGLLSVMFLFSGFFIKSSDIPDYWIYLHYLSLFKYAFDSLIINDLTNVTLHDPPMSNSDLLSYLSMNDISYGRGVGILWLFMVAFRIVFWYKLTTSFNGSRK